MERRDDLEDAAHDGPHRDYIEERNRGDRGHEQGHDAGSEARQTSQEDGPRKSFAPPRERPQDRQDPVDEEIAALEEDEDRHGESGPEERTDSEEHREDTAQDECPP